MQNHTVNRPNITLERTIPTRVKFNCLSSLNWILFTLVILLGGFRLQQITTHFFYNQTYPTAYYQYDFGAYYAASAALNINSNQSIYSRGVLENAAKISGMVTGFSNYIYPPFFAVLLQPIALLPHLIAIRVWALLNLLCLGLSAFILLKTGGININGRKFLLVFLFLLIFPPVYHNIIIFGQVNLLLLFLVSLTLYGSCQKENKTWQIIAGIALGLAVGIKIFYAILVIYYFFYNHRNIAINAILTIFVTIIIGIFGAGLTNTLVYFRDILLGLNQIENNFWINLSIEPTIKRFFSSGEYAFQLFTLTKPSTNGIAIFRPLIHSIVLGKTLAFVVKYIFALLTGSCFIVNWFSQKQKNQNIYDLLRVSFLLVSVVLFLPLGWFSAFALVIAPLVFLWQYSISKSIDINYFYCFSLIVYLLLLVNDSFFYLDYLFHHTISTIFLSLGFLSVMSIWLILGIILINHQDISIKTELKHIFDQTKYLKTFSIWQILKTHIPLWGILGLATVVRYLAMYGKGLWYDELQSVTHAILPLPDLLTSVHTFDPHPPLYYIQLHYWLKLGTSDLWIKSNSVLILIIAIASLYFVTYKYFNRRTAILVSLLFAISPYAVNYGSEARNYALWMLLVIWVYELNNLVILCQRKFLPGVGLFFVTVAFLYLHGISFLILPAVYLHALIFVLRKETKPSQLWTWMIIQISIIVAYIPWLQRAWTIGNVTPAVVPGFKDIITTLFIHLFGYCNTCPIWLQTIAIITWLAICIYTVIRWQSSRIVVLAYLFTPILTTIAISYLLRPIWLFRGLGLIVPFMLLTVAIWLDRLLDNTNWRRTTAIALTTLTFSIFSLALYTQTDTLVYPWDFKHAAKFVKTNIQPGEVIYLAHERLFWCWNWYFLGPGKTNPIRSDYSTRIGNNIRILSKPSWAEPPPNEGYWQVYRTSDQPMIDTSNTTKRIWNFEELIVEYISPNIAQ